MELSDVLFLTYEEVLHFMRTSSACSAVRMESEMTACCVQVLQPPRLPLMVCTSTATSS